MEKREAASARDGSGNYGCDENEKKRQKCSGPAAGRRRWDDWSFLHLHCYLGHLGEQAVEYGVVMKQIIQLIRDALRLGGYQQSRHLKVVKISTVSTDALHVSFKVATSAPQESNASTGVWSVWSVWSGRTCSGDPVRSDQTDNYPGNV
ncbi:hypothetical protein VFPPC_15323 [Pochonia chlamydosporia 170]|uniref:Uncharacterized protein n=1 Tax=Pochonia chlamydosporia 170 TaxID=1380566 RepID=A0A179G6Z5_METCM|nr:hypothetical protein VFPPC_15323 [Pochonia chlamydosporia 170]OAQ73567.1 hypothetical protein VFPPC_15323 [Pochonia chlamydosporia 170]